jgi:SAM-dependent methyltransferase
MTEQDGGRDAYVLDSVEAERELNRIRAIEADWGPKTARHLIELGIAPGWRCLEIGGGGGGVARWLAERVGLAGHVVATDINTRFLDAIDLPNLEVRRHNILTDEIEQGAFDVAHCRLLLLHLREPERVLERMIGALRPGGALLVEEPLGDFGRGDPAWPRAADYERASQKHVAGLQALGVDMSLGSRLPGILTALGLVDVGGEVTAKVARGGDSLIAKQRVGTAQALRPKMVAAGIATDAEIEEYIGLLTDPSRIVVEPSVISVWGRRAG